MNFEQFLQQKGIIPATIARHKIEAQKYEKWLDCVCDKTPENADKKDLLDYLQYIKEKRNITNATQGNILQKLNNKYYLCCL